MNKIKSLFLYNNIVILTLSLIIIGAFLFTRLYNLPSSLEFFGDIGRDHLELYNWWLSGKPPLLGPGISYFALHLPPWYFYLNYPVFFLSNLSPYSTVITLIILYILVFICGTIIFSRQKKVWIVFIIMLLVIFHPQYILQNRLPWNPAFAPPFLFIAIFSFLSLLEKYSIKKTILLGTSLGAAVSLSVQIIPLVLLFLMMMLIRFKNRLKMMSVLAIIFLVFLSPLILFEIRHNLFFINRLIQNPISQPIQTDMLLKLQKELGYIFGITEWTISNILLLTIVLMIVFGSFIFLLRNIRTDYVIRKQATYLMILFLGVFFLTCITPFPAREYDIFGVTVLLFSFISLLPWKASLVIIILLLVIWNPLHISNYWSPGHRTIANMESCAKLVCNKEKDPMFITVQAWHSYHKTPEYQFLFLKYGCNVEDITHQPDWSNRMAVIADTVPYEHGKTSFNELTLFGKASEKNIYSCDKNLKVHILGKE